MRVVAPYGAIAVSSRARVASISIERAMRMLHAAQSASEPPSGGGHLKLNGVSTEAVTSITGAASIAGVVSIVVC
jgi:hypothetical protein